MKKILFCVVAAAIALTACNNEWDNYYTETYPDSAGDNTERLTMSLLEFFETKTEFSAFYNVMKSVGADEELKRDQNLTFFAIENSNMEGSTMQEGDTLTVRYHYSNLSVAINDLYDGQRFLTKSGVFVNVKIDPNGTITLNDEATILKNYTLDNGIVYVIDVALLPRLNMYTFVELLSDEYSMYRDSLLAENIKIFDLEKSIPIGTTMDGNTIYDSVFYIENPLFDYVDITSEYNLATILIPNNDVITQFFDDLKQTCDDMGPYLYNYDDQMIAKAWQWILQSTLYNGLGILDGENEDITSPWHNVYLDDAGHPVIRRWRKTVQQVNPEPYILSNGEAYYVEYMRMPRLNIIKRFKDYWYHYADIPADDRAPVYGLETRGITSMNTAGSSAVAHVTGADKYGEPNYRYLSMNWTHSENPYFYAYPLILVENADGTKSYEFAYVPEGEYVLWVGFHSETLADYVTLTVEHGGEDSPLVYEKISVRTSNPWHYDRNNGNSSYGEARADGLGGQIGTLTVAPNNPDGSKTGLLRFKYEYAEPDTPEDSKKKLNIYHWAIVPTNNNY